MNTLTEQKASEETEPTQLVAPNTFTTLRAVEFWVKDKDAEWKSAVDFYNALFGLLPFDYDSPDTNPLRLDEAYKKAAVVFLLNEFEVMLKRGKGDTTIYFSVPDTTKIDELMNDLTKIPGASIKKPYQKRREKPKRHEEQPLAPVEVQFGSIADPSGNVLGIINNPNYRP